MDPPHHELRPAFQALRGKDFVAAHHLFEALLAAYPESASLRLWCGESLLGLGDPASLEAALVALNDARALDERGCHLRDRERYYLSITVADVEISQKKAVPALSELSEAARLWSDSAEVQYLRARAECLLGRIDDCWSDLQGAVIGAHSAQRPRFVRAHRASDDWLLRSQEQAELAPLRKDPRYQALLRSAPLSDGGPPHP